MQFDLQKEWKIYLLGVLIKTEGSMEHVVLLDNTDKISYCKKRLAELFKFLGCK